MEKLYKEGMNSGIFYSSVPVFLIPKTKKARQKPRLKFIRAV
jgi:hypothetical protein